MATSNNTSLSILPIDVINRIMTLSSIQQDKMYIPEFEHSNGKIHWNFNLKNTKIQKIADLYSRIHLNMRFEDILIQNIVYKSKIMTFYDEKGNKVEYVEVFNHLNPKMNMYLYLKYSRLLKGDFTMLLSGILYDISRSEYAGSLCELLRIQLIYRQEMDEHGFKNYYTFPHTLGSWMYDRELHTMEFIVDSFDDLDMFLGDDEDDEDTTFVPEWANDDDWNEQMTLANIPLLNVYM